MATKDTQAEMIGGPLDGLPCVFRDRGQNQEILGPEGDRNYVYRRSEKPTKSGKVRWIYDSATTNLLMQATTAPVVDRTGAMTLAKADDPDDATQERVRVEVKLAGKEWHLMIDGEAQAAVVREKIQNAADAAAWIEAMGIGKRASHG